MILVSYKKGSAPACRPASPRRVYDSLSRNSIN